VLRLRGRDTILQHAGGVVSLDSVVSPQYGGWDVEGIVAAEDEEVFRDSSKGERGSGRDQTFRYIRLVTDWIDWIATENDDDFGVVWHHRLRKSLPHRRRTLQGRERHGQRGRFEAHGFVHCENIRYQSFRHRQFTYFATMLPGSATLTVQLRPCVGLKTAVGLEVSRATAAPLPFSWASLLRFRF
jgi:hypothetical protein